MSYAFHVVCRYADGTGFTSPEGYLSRIRAEQEAARFRRGGRGRRAYVQRIKIRDAMAA